MTSLFNGTALLGLKKSIDAMRMEAADSFKEQKLMWAIEHADLKKFSYRLIDSNETHDTKSLVVEILLQFRRGEGYRLKTSRLYEPDEQYFLNMLSIQIESLTGVQPTIERLDEEHHMIYYS